MSTWDNMWGGEVLVSMKSNFVLQDDPDEKPIPKTSRKRRFIPVDEVIVMRDRRRALLRYLACGRSETCKEISAGLGFDAAQTIGVLARASVLMKVCGQPAKWRLNNKL